MKLMGIELPFEEFDRLICEQNNGKQLIVKEGKVIAIERIETENGKREKELFELKSWFDNFFDKQLIQSTWQTNFKVSKDTYFKNDKGEAKTYLNIEELKEQAEYVRSRIKQLKD